MGRRKKTDKACKQLALTASAAQRLKDWKYRGYGKTYSEAIEKVNRIINQA